MIYIVKNDVRQESAGGDPDQNIHVFILGRIPPVAILTITLGRNSPVAILTITLLL